MKARLLRAAALADLRVSTPRNLEIYRKGKFDYLEADPAFSLEHEVEIDVDALAGLRSPTRGSLYDVENCEMIHRALNNLSPYDARDERLWVFLSHTALLDHGRRRWPIPADDEQAVKHITKHWFARDKRQVERDNVGSRLWWMGHLCFRVEGVNHDLALRAFLFRSDVRANLVERPTVSQSIGLFSAIIRRLAQSYAGGQHLLKRTVFRRLMTEINSIGGYRLLDCLGDAEIERILDTVIAQRLRLAEL